MFNLEQFGEGVSLVVGIGTPKHAKKPFLKVLAEKRNETKKKERDSNHLSNTTGLTVLPSQTFITLNF